MLRLVFGIAKGLLVGGLVGMALVALGHATPAAWLAYASAALVAVLIAPIAGKKLWEKDGAIQFGLKAFAGLLLGPGLMWVVRRFAGLPLPDVTALPSLRGLPGFAALEGVSLTLGGFALTSLAAVAALIAGFYDLDNTPSAGGTGGGAPRTPPKRIDPELAAITGLDPSELEAASDEATRRRDKA